MGKARRTAEVAAVAPLAGHRKQYNNSKETRQAMQALPNGHDITELPISFPCAACGNTIHPQAHTLASGYAVRESDNEMVCYACAHKQELQDAKDTGHLFAYVKGIHYHRSRFAGIRRMPTYFAEWDTETSIGTWPGLALSVGRVRVVGTWQSNMGDVRIAIRAALPTGSNGSLEPWHGTYYASAGDYCRMRRSKQRATTSNGKG